MGKLASKQMIFIYSVLFLLLCWFFQIAGASDVDEINKAIKENDAKWKASKTSVSELSENDQKLRCGTIVSDEKLKGTLPSIAGQVSLGSSYNWDIPGQNRLNGDYVTPVRDQGNCGSCWAFSAIGQLESVKEIFDTNPANLDLSEQYLVSCEGDNFGCDGGYMDRAYNFLKNSGTPDESSFPYAQLNTPIEVPCKTCSNFTKIYGWASVARSVDALKSSISLHPTSVTFNVYNDFFSYNGGVYERVSKRKSGGHAVLAIGWDDNAPYSKKRKGAFICKNSWGTGWGENSSGGTTGEKGYFRIAYSQVTDSFVLFGGGAGNYAMDISGSPAPPRYSVIATLWGEMKTQ